MNKLQIVSALVAESGLSNTPPTTTVGQVGDFGDTVRWVENAYNKIQLKHSSWAFLRKDFSFNTVASTANYLNTSVADADHMKWVWQSFRVYLAATGVNDEQVMTYVPWDLYRDVYLLASQRNTEGRPTFFTIRPNKSINFFPIPDDVYTVVGEYYRVPDTMTLDADEPIFPSEFHDMLVWRSLMFYAADHSEPDKYAVGRDEYQDIMFALEDDQLEEMEFGEPLA